MKPFSISDIYENFVTIGLPDRSFDIASVNYRNNTYSSSRILSQGVMPSDFNGKAEAAEKVYENCPIVRQAVSMFIDLIFHSIIIRHEDEDVEKIIRKLFDESNIEEAIEAILLDYFIYGNAFPYRYRGDAIFDPYDETLNEVEPFMWINLDPKKVDIIGNTITEKEYVLKSSFASAESYTLDETVLDKELIYHIANKKPVRNKKADPPLAYLSRAVDLYIAYTDLAMSALENPIPAFVHVQVGTTPKGVAASRGIEVKQSVIDKTISAIKNVSERSFLVTSDAVEAKTVSPPMNSEGEKIQIIYNNVIQQIEEGLGISREMITSSVAGGGSLQWFNITKLVKTLEAARAKITKWLNNEMKYIIRDLDEEGVLSIPDNPPVVRLEELSLRDDETIKNILLKLFDRGIISVNTMLEECDLDLYVELNRKVMEKNDVVEYEGNEYTMEEIFTPPQLPFQGNKDPGDYGDQGGRPSGVSTPLEEPREGA